MLIVLIRVIGPFNIVVFNMLYIVHSVFKFIG